MLTWRTLFSSICLHTQRIQDGIIILNKEKFSIQKMSLYCHEIWILKYAFLDLLFFAFSPQRTPIAFQVKYVLFDVLLESMKMKFISLMTFSILLVSHWFFFHFLFIMQHKPVECPIVSLLKLCTCTIDHAKKS